jgi:uncharacterized protein (DUF433 family)
MGAIWTNTFTPTEAAALTDLSEKQVRKEIEYRVIEAPSPPRLSFAALVYLRALKLMAMQLSVEDRTRISRRVLEAMGRSQEIDTVEVSEVLALRLGSLVRDLVERTQRFERWKGRLITAPDIMGGEPVFPGSRLTVRRVGGMLERGEDASAILEDYPHLTREDLEFARLHVRAYPRVGRPRSGSSAG